MRRTFIIAVLVIVLIGLLIGLYLEIQHQPGLTAQTSTSVQNPFGAPSGNASDLGGSPGSGGGSGTTGDTGTPVTGIASQVAPHLVEISAAPVASGSIILDPVVATTTTTTAAATKQTSSKHSGKQKAATTTPATAPPVAPPPPPQGADVRYIDRESGNMLSYNTLTLATTRLTNHTAPGVEETSWLSDGSIAYIRFLTTDQDGSEHIDTYALPANNSDGYMLTRDLGQVVARNLSSIFAFMPATSGSIGTLENPDGSGSATLFSSPLSSLTFKNAGTNMVAYTKPSSALYGYAFLVSPSGGFTRILGPLTGLSVTPSPSGRYLLMSYIAEAGLRLFVYDTTAHTQIELPLVTMADKCAWGSGEITVYCFVPVLLPPGLPDSWYEGITPLADRLWKVDMAARVATQVADLPSLTSEPIDGFSPVLDKNEGTLVFMNKRDDSLWAYNF